jgi:hypothetical protein
MQYNPEIIYRYYPEDTSITQIRMYGENCMAENEDIYS